MKASDDSPASDSEGAPIRIGISACLLGERVRFDANHKHDAYINGTLGLYFEFVPVCPEVAIGMGVPRPPIRLAGDPERPRAVGVKDPSMDVTEQLEGYGRRMAGELAGISGYILKSKSPSCGMERVKVYQPPNGIPLRGQGLFARELMAGLPLVPVEEEGRLGDPVLRENFIQRVFAFHHWQRMTASGVTPAKLVDFHSVHKLTLMAHGPEHYRSLGRLVADAGKRPIEEVADEYVRGFMEALHHRATRKRHTNVLQHLAGYLKRVLDRDDKQELVDCIDQYRLGLVPLIVPLTLLRHHFRRHPDEYVERQVYMNPHPREMMLLNHI